ncbi:hypothetical protein [Chelatococcus composti]|uniref:Uncharacterized protein n=1 Tax=Chelatococcus composti TaxID=1743235 RepID=A0A841K9F9_9HYPH|nr:hypothetical protein [Chelatococcus composti]MBB6169498.1 hypothetical protein [Chelatococcus composti]MBS7737061.1 hypothetical protein [Chelatococcus composti]GGG48200.1 hypothetical protein GCM10008026_31820 [Chelatococcus composti]
MTSAILTIAACAVLNRARGDDRWMPDWMPGRALFPVSIAIGLIGACFDGLWYGAAFGAAFFVWAVGPWGHLIGLGRFAPDRPASGLETALIELAAGNAHLALGLRHLFALPGLMIAAAISGELLLGVPGALAFAAFATGAYELSWRLRPSNPIIVAELLTGALWGGLAVALA